MSATRLVSRPLCAVALATLALAGFVPLAVLAPRLTWDGAVGLIGARTAALLGRSIALGGGAVLVALPLGVAFGWLAARTDLPLARALRALAVVPLALPPLVLAIAWTGLAELRGAPAALLILASAAWPLVALFAARAFERVDARREEAARLAGGLGAVLSMELPLVAPAALAGAALALTLAISDFAVPDYVSSVGTKINVYADEVMASWREGQDAGRAVAAGLPLAAVALAALALVLRARRRGALATLGGYFVRPAPLALGVWRWPAFAGTALLVGLSSLAPLARLAWEAGGGPGLARLEQPPRGLAAASAWASNAAQAFDQALGWSAGGAGQARADLRNSLVYAALAAALCALVGLVLGHAVERLRRRAAGEALALASVLPLAAPPMLLGIGMVVAWNRPWSAALYDGPGVVVLLHVARFVGLATLVLAGGAAALDPRLEEAAMLAGAGPARRLASIAAPALKGALAGALVLVFVLGVRELDAAIHVPAANHTAMVRLYNGVHFARDAYVAALALALALVVLLPGLAWMTFARRRLELLP